MYRMHAWKGMVSALLLLPLVLFGQENIVHDSNRSPVALELSASAPMPEPARPVVNHGLRYFPLEHGVEPQPVAVEAETNRIHAAPAGPGGGADERLVYSNTEGRFVLALRANQRVADDLTLTARKDCFLSRYTFQVSGRADPTGLGGPYRVTYGLYSTCPQAGGILIAGTAGALDVPDDAPRQIEVTIPGEVALTRTTLWLGVQFNRDNCGIGVGAPALEGYSSDIFDFPLLDCDGNLGGFPTFPHASFNARVYTDAACDDAYPGYRNIAPAKPGHNFGAGLRYADDVEMSVQTCDLIGFEIGVKGQAAYNVDLRRDAGNFPGSVIEGTQTQVLSLGSNIQVSSYKIDPPIHLVGAPIRVWMTVRPNLNTGTWIRTGRNAQIGDTAASLAKETAPDSGIWQIVFPEEDVYGAYYAVLTCAGRPPTGACCDMYVTDAQGDAVCRTVPEMNCPFPPRGSALMPPWEEGVSCRVCDGGCRDGLACESDAECDGAVDGTCVDGTCSGGCRTGEHCEGDEDCAGAEAGLCLDNDPFLLPCGQSACCTPRDGCINLTRNECEALGPDYRTGQWHIGQFCGLTPGLRCPYPACTAGVGDCTEPREEICNGGDHDGIICGPPHSDSTCRGKCFLNRCIGGCHDGAACTRDLDCNCDGVCDDTDPNNPRCAGGARAGQFCDPDRGNRDCMESYCELFPGCEDPDCCTAVCDYAPGLPLYTEFCCQVEWDSICAELARDPDLGLCPNALDCPFAVVIWHDPPVGVIDAGRPHHPDDVTALEGIQTLLLRAPTGAGLGCWSIKETLQNTSLHPDYEPGLDGNDVVQLLLQESGEYMMVLRRPITPGERTAICYPNGKFGNPCSSFVAHPGDVNADGTTDMFDIAVLIDVLLGRTEAPWGLYSTDIDRDGSQTFLDLLELVDLLVGAGEYGVWWGSWIP